MRRVGWRCGEGRGLEVWRGENRGEGLNCGEWAGVWRGGRGLEVWREESGERG